MKEAGAVLALWTEGWDTRPCDWWYLCCDQGDYDLAKLKKGARYDVRTGLDQCEVRRLDPKWFAENGYSVYAAAFRHYGERPTLSEAGFVIEFLNQAEYPGRETWGAFLGGKLVAWHSCIVVDDAVALSSAKSDPAYFKARPNNALLYVLTRHYLQDRHFAYVTSGSRVLVHDTKFQDFQERMGYRKIFCFLRAEFSAAASIVNSLQLGRWGRRFQMQRVLPSALTKLEALAAIRSISRSCQEMLDPPSLSPAPP